MQDAQKPKRVAPRLKSAPKIRQLYWCDFPKDAQLPEFWKSRPVIIVSYRNTLSGSVTVIPCSTEPQDANQWAVAIKTAFTAEKSWAICDKPYTVAVSRLSMHRDGIKRLPESEFNAIITKLMDWLPEPKPLQN